MKANRPHTALAVRQSAQFAFAHWYRPPSRRGGQATIPFEPNAASPRCAAWQPALLQTRQELVERLPREEDFGRGGALKLCAAKRFAGNREVDSLLLVAERAVS
jgi:hypothetical protein